MSQNKIKSKLMKNSKLLQAKYANISYEKKTLFPFVFLQKSKNGAKWPDNETTHT